MKRRENSTKTEQTKDDKTKERKDFEARTDKSRTKKRTIKNCKDPPLPRAEGSKLKQIKLLY